MPRINRRSPWWFLHTTEPEKACSSASLSPHTAWAVRNNNKQLLCATNRVWRIHGHAYSKTTAHVPLTQQLTHTSLPPDQTSLVTVYLLL